MFGKLDRIFSILLGVKLVQTLDTNFAVLRMEFAKGVNDMEAPCVCQVWPGTSNRVEMDHDMSCRPPFGDEGPCCKLKLSQRLL